jgi:uncharacterized protein
MTPFLPRELAPRLDQALKRMPVVILSGLRQSGKSTLLTEERGLLTRTYQTLDDFEVLAAARSDPQALLEASDPVTIDEVQRCPELLPVIKRVVDRARKPGRFLLSGSANLALIAGVSETLAGRAVYLTLFPMTRREIRRQTQRPSLLMRLLAEGHFPQGSVQPISNSEILLGGLPPVCLEPEQDPELWFRGYVQTYIERDVRQLSQIADLIAFRNFTNLAALRTGQVVNISTLGRDAKLSAATAARYLHLLEASFLIRQIPPFLNNRSSRLVKSPKLYFTDSGLAAYLTQTHSLDVAAMEPMRGPLFENYVLQNFSSILEAHLPDASIAFWHEQGRHEVDFVIESRKKVWAFEIKAAARWSESDLNGLKAFMERTPQCVAGILAYNGKSTVPLGPKLWAVPLGHLLA